MEVTFEALISITDRCPACVFLRTDIAVEDELQVGTALDVIIK